MDIPAFFQKGIRLFHQLVSFLLLCSDIDNSHGGIFLSHYILKIHRTHLGKLQQMFRPGIYVCSAVDKEGKALLCWKKGCQSWSFDPLDPSYYQLSPH